MGLTDSDKPLIFQRLDQTSRAPYSSGEYLRRFLWLLVQATVFRLPIPRAYAWRRFWLRLFGAKLGTAAAVHSSTRIMHPWLLELGDWSAVGPGVVIYNLGPIKIGSHTVISQETYLCAGTHDYTKPDLPLLRPPITISDGVWIAAQAFVGPGVNIGSNSIIGARSVVVADLPANVLAAGNPCRVLKPRPMCG
jgi:putative colanic acid biosynthesis acetyltransferase WcaF